MIDSTESVEQRLRGIIREEVQSALIDTYELLQGKFFKVMLAKAFNLVLGWLIVEGLRILVQHPNLIFKGV